METLPDKSAAIHVSLRRLCLSLVVKRMRRVLASAMAVMLVGLLVVLIWLGHTEPRPPVLHLVSMDPLACSTTSGNVVGNVEHKQCGQSAPL